MLFILSLVSVTVLFLDEGSCSTGVGGADFLIVCFSRILSPKIIYLSLKFHFVPLLSIVFGLGVLVKVNCLITGIHSHRSFASPFGSIINCTPASLVLSSGLFIIV
jgi:hypothetical protein